MGYKEIAVGAVRCVEKKVKETLFDCRMYGQCVLSYTALVCPMRCPKGLRNGPFWVYAMFFASRATT